jgi:[ribosomal protein S18]-alanine N-acetyltransferase
MSSDTVVRQITPDDLASLSYLVNNAEYIHRHLDWRSPLDWMGEEPFLGIERQRRLLATLACPRGQSTIGWIRLFAFVNWNKPQLEECWNQLFQSLTETIPPETKYTFAGLGLQSWFVDLMQRSGFSHRQDIVVLQWMGQVPTLRLIPPEITIRPMTADDLPKVINVDNNAFHPLWQHTLNELQLAFQQAVYASVLDMKGEIVGYQVCTGTRFHAHLARLAVDPGLQRMSLGYAMVRDLLEYFSNRGIQNITVNTQSDNHASLSLYQKLGFQKTGDDFPVFTYTIF